jgi:hypothetical protein
MMKGNTVMKQKYLIVNDKKNKQFKIQEFAELDKDSLSLLCEETYDYKTIKSAITLGEDALIAALRTNNLYPPGSYAHQIAVAVIGLHKSKTRSSVELFFDDIELLTQKRQAVQMTPELDEEPAELDEVLEDEFDDKEDIKKIDLSLKIADDDYVDIDDDD